MTVQLADPDSLLGMLRRFASGTLEPSLQQVAVTVLPR